MHAARIIAPFAVATLVTGAVPVLQHSQAAAFASVDSVHIALTQATEQFSQSNSGPSSARRDHGWGDFGDWEDWGGQGGGSQNWWGGGFSFDLGSILTTIVGQLTANNGALLTAIQTAVSSVVSSLAGGASVAQALANAGQQLATAIGGNAGTAVQAGLNAVGQLLTFAPKLISGALTIAAALPSAVAPVVTAVTAAVTNVLGALGSADLTTVIATGIKNVTSAVAQGISTITAAVQSVLTGQPVTPPTATALARSAAPAGSQDTASTPVTDKHSSTDAPEAEATGTTKSDAGTTKSDTEASDDTSDSSAPAAAGSARTVRAAAASPAGSKKASDSAAGAGAEKSSPSGASAGSARTSGKRGAHTSAD